MNLINRAKQLKRDIPAVFLALKHKETPIIAKALAAITIIYALSPIDLIPDFIPLLGYLDDVILLPAMVSLTIHFIPKAIFKQCQEEAAGMWAHGKPKKWRYAIPILFIWLIVIFLIVKAICL